MDLDNARKLLDQAAAINPSELGLWSAYAGIAGLLGMNNQAWDDVKRELANHPEEVKLYPGLVQALLAHNDPEGALPTLRAWVKADPSSLAAALALAHCLIDLKKFSDALKETRIAIDTLAATGIDLTDLKIAAAKAHIGLGETSLAANSVAPLLKTATDPAQINDIARVLAQGSAFLTEAEAAESKVLAESEAKTSDWTPTSSSPANLDQQNRIAAEWDTMALILSHEGKFTHALGYANAALHAGVADAHSHLASINAVLHSPAATATLRADDVKLRTFPLATPDGAKGFLATLLLLLADGKVLDSSQQNHPTSSAPVFPVTAADLVKTADLHDLFPPGSKAHLIRFGSIDCYHGPCVLVLSPIDATQIMPVSPPSRLPSTQLPITIVH